MRKNKFVSSSLPSMYNGKNIVMRFRKYMSDDSMSLSGTWRSCQMTMHNTKMHWK